LSAGTLIVTRIHTKSRQSTVATFLPSLKRTIGTWSQSYDRELHTTPRVAQCVSKTETFSYAVKNALAHDNDMRCTYVEIVGFAPGANYIMYIKYNKRPMYVVCF
jgi:hypothetical protein